MAEPDYYAVLGVDIKAPPEVIKAAYYALARKYHPDTTPGTTLLGTQFQKVTRAYDVLSDPQRRADYDAGLNSAKAGQAPHASQPPQAYPPSTTETKDKPPKVTSTISHTGEPVLVFRRLIAVLIDIVLWVLLTVAVMLITWGLLATHGISIASDEHGHNIGGQAGAITLIIGPLVYWIVCWSTISRTVGMVCMDGRVSRPDGSRLGFLRATGRLVACILSLLPVGLGFWWAAWDERHLAWHDKLAGSVVRRC
jgi:uncharacterized RDD family membrane protein YckC